jgi:hypothetical protein
MAWRYGSRTGRKAALHMLLHVAAICAVALVFSALNATEAHASAPVRKVCTISDGATFGNCFGNAAKFDDFVFMKDVVCSTEASCCPKGRAPIVFQGLQDKRIVGNGHSLRRQAGQHKCPAVILRQVKNLSISDLTFDEDRQSPPCELAEHTCPSTIDIANSQSVQLEGVSVFDGKGYVVKVWSTDGFSFDRGVIVRAGIIGLYVGHFKFGPSHDIQITNSLFVRNRTNAIALQGAYSDNPQHPVLVSDNVFVENHWHGLWPIPGGVTTGGQIFIGDGSNVRVSGNIVSGRPCENCFRSTHVNGIEIGETVPSPAPSGVAGITIDNNTIIGTDEHGFAVQQNPESLVSGVVISQNTVIGYDALDRVHARALREGNSVRPATPRNLSHTGPDVSLHPGGHISALFLCSRKDGSGAPFQSAQRDCAGAGHVVAVLGFQSGNR